MRKPTKDLHPGDTINVGSLFDPDWRVILGISARRKGTADAFYLTVSHPQLPNGQTLHELAHKTWEVKEDDEMTTKQSKPTTPTFHDIDPTITGRILKAWAGAHGGKIIDIEAMTTPRRFAITAAKDIDAALMTRLTSHGLKSIARIYGTVLDVEVPEDWITPVNEAQQAKADLAGDGKIAPLAASVILSGVATSLSAARADDLEQQLAEGQAEWESEKALMQKRIAELEAQVSELLTWKETAKSEYDDLEQDYQSTRRSEKILLEQRDELRVQVAPLRATIQEQNAKIEALGQAAADGQALMAAAQVFAEVIKRAKQTPEVTAPVSAGAYHSNGEAKP